MNELLTSFLKELRSTQKTGRRLITASLFGLLLFAVADYFEWFGLSLLEKAAPQFTAPYIARSLALMILAGLSVVGLLHLYPRQQQTEPTKPNIGIRRTRSILLLSLGLSALFIVSPSLFSAFSREDHLVETASFWALILATLLAIRSAVLTWNGQRRSDHAAALLIAIIASIFFIIGMEEVSWLQREIGFVTPDAIASRNMQGEFNLHNLNTHAAEVIYYTGATIALVLIPFTLWAHPHLWRTLRLGHALPQSHLIAIGALISSFTCSMWNMLPIQFSFWFSQGVVLGVILTSTNPHERRSMLWILLAALGIQVIFLLGYARLIRHWEVTEYREMLIAIGLLFYTLDVFISANRTSSHRRTVSE
jgi:hypothetical protein